MNSPILDKTNRIIHLNESVIKLSGDFVEILLRSSLFDLSESKVFNADRSKVKSDIINCTLKDVLKNIIDCEHKTITYSQQETEYAVVRTNNIKDGKFVYADLMFTEKCEYLEWTKRKIPSIGDILFTREAPAGESCLVPNKYNVCLGQRLVLIEPDLQVINPKYLSRYLSSKFVKHYIRKFVVGTTVERINISDIWKVRMLLPPIEKQNRLVEAIEAMEKILLEGENIARLLPIIIEGLI